MCCVILWICRIKVYSVKNIYGGGINLILKEEKSKNLLKKGCQDGVLFSGGFKKCL